MQFACLWQNCKQPLKFLCWQHEFLHTYFCPAISKVPTPNHDVLRSLATAKDYITPDWRFHTLQATSTHVWKQCPCFLHPICIHFGCCITDKITRKWCILLGMISAPDPNAHLDLESCPNTYQTSFKNACEQFCKLKRIHMHVLWIVQIWLK